MKQGHSDQAAEKKPVVDFHIHVLSGRNDWTQEAHKLIEKYNPSFYEKIDENTTAAGVLARMDESGIDYAVVLPEYAPLTHGTITNEFAAELCAGNERLIPFCSINPHLVSGPGQVAARLFDDGFRGVKLLPTYNHFYLSEPVLYPLYNEAQERGLPVLVHTGSSVFKGSKLKYGDPLLIDEIAVDFPRLKLVMAHGGRGFWYDRAAFLCRLHENVYIDLTGLPPSNYMKYYPDFEKITDKLVYGSDWPTTPSRNEAISAIRNMNISNEAKENILGMTAAKLLDLL